MESQPKPIAKNEGAGGFAAASTRRPSRAESFVALSAEDSLLTGQHPRAVSGTGTGAELQLTEHPDQPHSAPRPNKCGKLR